MHLKPNGLRSLQYYKGTSQCLAIAEVAWTGGSRHAQSNFELRKFHHPHKSWKSPTPLKEEGFERFPPDPDWLLDHLYEVNHHVEAIRASIDRISIVKKQRIGGLKSKSPQNLTPFPDLHLSRDMGHNPG